MNHGDRKLLERLGVRGVGSASPIPSAAPLIDPAWSLYLVAVEFTIDRDHALALLEAAGLTVVDDEELWLEPGPVHDCPDCECYGVGGRTATVESVGRTSGEARAQIETVLLEHHPLEGMARAAAREVATLG